MDSLISPLVIQSMPIASRAAAKVQFPRPVTCTKVPPFVGLSIMRFSAVEGVDFRVFPVRGRDNLEVRLKQAVTEHAQVREHRSAKDNCVNQWSAVYVPYHIREAGANEHFANRLN